MQRRFAVTRLAPHVLAYSFDQGFDLDFRGGAIAEALPCHLLKRRNAPGAEWLDARRKSRALSDWALSYWLSADGIWQTTHRFGYIGAKRRGRRSARLAFGMVYVDWMGARNTPFGQKLRETNPLIISDITLYMSGKRGF